MATKKRTSTGKATKASPVYVPDITRAPKERWQHGAQPEEEYVEPQAAVRTQRLRTGLRQLYNAGTIGDQEMSASTRWYQDYALGVHGARERPGNQVRVDCSPRAPDISIARVAALGRHRAACAAVGPLGMRILEACVAEGLSMQGAAEVVGLNRQALSGAVQVVLDQLGEHYHRVDTERPTKAPSAPGAAHESMAA